MSGSASILDIADRLENEQRGQEEKVESPETWVSFTVGGRGFALPVHHLRGAHRVDHITAVPQAPEGLRGLSSLRGRVRPVVDLGVRLGIGPIEITDASRILEVEIEKRTLGLLVERAEHLTKILPSAIKTAADAVEPEIASCARGAYETRDTDVVLLDPDLLLRHGLEDSSNHEDS